MSTVYGFTHCQNAWNGGCKSNRKVGWKLEVDTCLWLTTLSTSSLLFIRCFQTINFRTWLLSNYTKEENMESLLSLTVLCLAFINIGLTTPQQQCQFPQSWEGTWYHSGFPHPLNISRNHISSKGTCLQQSGSMFILADK